MKKLPPLLALFAMTLAAADVTGTWKGSAETQNGTVERTFNFKSEGGKVTGETISQMMGKSEINDGKLEGDKLSFWINVKFQDNEMKVNYTGKVDGDTIKFTADGGQFQIEYVAKKVK